MSVGDRPKPNILVTGTPGTGKSVVCEVLKEATGLQYYNVGDIVKEHGFYDGKDEEMDS